MLGIISRGSYHHLGRRQYWSAGRRRTAPVAYRLYQQRKWKVARGQVTKLRAQHVSTWTPLAATFNAKPAPRLGLNLTGRKTGLFGMEELQQPEGFYVLQERAIAATDRLVAESCDPDRSRKMVTIFDDLSDTLCKVADMAEFIRIAHPDAKYAAAAEEVSLSINALVERLNTNRDIYEALKHVVDKGDIVVTDPVDQHVAELFLFDFEQSGIHLDRDKRARVVDLNERILQTGALFMQGTTLARSVSKDKLPKVVHELFPHQGDNVVVSDLHADSPNDLLREVAYKIFMHPDARQERRLNDLLMARQELAHLCGFPTFAHRVLRGSLAESPSMVVSFLEALSSALGPYTQVDVDAMLNAKLRTTGNALAELKMWDAPYLSAIIKNEKFNITTAEYMPYFSLGTCMEGLNFLFENLYGVTLQTEVVESSEIWSPEVHKLAVVDQTEGTLGYIYCDFLERPGKPTQDCHFTIRGGRQLPDGSYQLPVVVLMLNFPAPTWTCPSLLTPGMVENLFHEMGHAMHSMLARTKYQHVTGTRCSTDFAEVPSVLMEYFATDPRVLEHFARDYKTGEKIPYEKLLKFCQSRGSLCANDMQLQIFYAMVDQRYHGELAKVGLQPDNNELVNTTDILAQIQEQYYCIPHVPHTAWQHRFGHLIGYGAKYYSYLISKAVASWIWQKRFQTDPFDRNAGERYRNEVLQFGGGRPPKELLTRFLEEDVTVEALVNSLISEIESKQKVCYPNSFL